MSKSSRSITLVIVTIILFAIHINAQATSKKRVVPQKSDRENIESIVREYLIKNPEVIREAMLALQQKEEAQRQLGFAENLKRLSPEIYSDASAPFLGNASGDITVVVFYDYFCGYCKKTLPQLQELAAKDRSVKIIYKELPILGAQSLSAAKAVLAAARQGKFEQFHREMIESDSATDEAIKAISEKLGLDFAQLRKDMDDSQIAASIERNISLAASLNINGTPAYLVGNQLIPGAIDSTSLARIVESERAKVVVAEAKKTDVGQR
jgi:protein-disulfide isomerase